MLRAPHRVRSNEALRVLRSSCVEDGARRSKCKPDRHTQRRLRYVQRDQRLGGNFHGSSIRNYVRNRCSSQVHIKSFSRPHTVSGSSSTSLKDKFRNYLLGGLHDGSLDRAVAKAEALEDNGSTLAPATARCPAVPGADKCHLLLDNVVDVCVRMQQAVQVVQRETFPFIDRSSGTDNSDAALDPVHRRRAGHSSCVTETGTPRCSSLTRLLTLVVVHLMTPKMQSRTTQLLDADVLLLDRRHTTFLMHQGTKVKATFNEDVTLMIRCAQARALWPSRRVRALRT